jgi:hypothetical protein
MLILLLVWLYDETLMVRFYLFWGGVGLSVLYFLVSISNIGDTRKRVKVGSKFLLGSGFAGISWSTLLFDGFFNHLTAKFLFIIFLYFGFVTLLNIKRSFEIFKECEGCEYKMRWSKCPGFRNMACKAIDAEFLYTEQTNENANETANGT